MKARAPRPPEPPPGGPRFAVYMRVSTEEQAERGTLENQADFARRYCELHGLAGVGSFSDDTSGSIPFAARPGGAALLEEARSGAFSVVLVYRIDRVGRTMKGILDAVHDLAALGVSVRSMTEPFESGTAAGDVMLGMLATFAQYERASIVERTREGTRRKVRAGVWTGGVSPYGYRAQGGALELDDRPVPGLPPNLATEAAVARQLFAWSLEGLSCGQVAARLNALGIPPPSASASRPNRARPALGWNLGSVRHILANPVYMGRSVFGKWNNTRGRNPDENLIEQPAPALVTPQEWEAVAQIRQANRAKGFWVNAKTAYLLRGLVVCQLCQRKYVGTGTHDRAGVLRAYYVCHGSMTDRRPGVERCQGKRLERFALESAVWSQIARFLQDPGEALALALEEVPQADQARAEAQVAALRAALAKKALERDQILTLYRRNLVGVDALELQLAQIAAEEDTLKLEEARSSKALRMTQEARQARQEAAQALETLRGGVAAGFDDQARRFIVEALVESVAVTTTGEGRSRRAGVTVRYRFGAARLPE